MPIADAASMALGYVLFMTLLSEIFLDERPSNRQVLALITGLLIVIQPGGENVD
jgi:drug/metabolite transporter (DMT)-like permease